MKKINLLLAMTIVCSIGWAQQESPAGVVKLRGTRLTYPLVGKWITEFAKEYPGISVKIAPAAPADSIDFSIASYALAPVDFTNDREGVAVARYVQLPIVNSQRPGLKELLARGITQRDLSDLFFTSNTPAFLASTSQANVPVLYVRDRPVCAVKAFAKHFDYDPKTLKGTAVKGDDQDLLEAVRKDVNGISFNNLGFIYNVKSRKLNEGIAVVPLDLNENGVIDKDEQVYGTLDDVIGYIERTHDPKFVNERVNFVYSKVSKNEAAGLFLNWILAKGQKYDHELGFIALENDFIKTQKDLALSTFNSPASSCEGGNAVIRKRVAKQQ